jgi:hypothetical protein
LPIGAGVVLNIFAHAIVPGTGYLNTALASGRQLDIGTGFEVKVEDDTWMLSPPGQYHSGWLMPLQFCTS